MITVRFQLLGGFALHSEGERIKISSQRLQGLLAYLALYHIQPQPRQRLAFLIWPDSSETQAYTNLRTLLHRLQSSFPQITQLINLDLQVLEWQPSIQLSLDVNDFVEAIEAANNALTLGDNLAAAQALEQAVKYYNGDLLPDCYDEWVLPERQHLRDLFLNCLENLVTLLEQSHNYRTAILYAKQIINIDPLNEAGYLRLMLLHDAKGERASALYVYHNCVTVLEHELGTVPGKALRAAYEQLVASEIPSSREASFSYKGSTTALIGRTREWKKTQAAWELAVAGQSRLLAISGEAGVGKTRLAEELIYWARGRGIITAISQCYAAEGDLAFAPIATLLRSDELKRGLQQLDKIWRSDVARIAPDLFANDLSVNLQEPLTQRWQYQRLFEALARAVFVSERSTLLMIDDLQWSSPDTLEWLHYLLRFKTDTNLLVVATIRAEEFIENKSLVELLDTLRREGNLSEIPLMPLNKEDTTHLASSVLGAHLPDEKAAHLFIETEGNPLFVVETVRAGLMNVEEKSVLPNVVEKTATQLPSKIQAVIERRLNQLTTHTRNVLDVAAIIGRSFTFEVLAQSCDVDEATLVQTLDELWQRRILREQGQDSYDFSHDKLRDITYTNLSQARRKLLHRRVAQALEIVYSSDLESKSGQIAQHYDLAQMPGEAVRYYQRAAQFAQLLFAHEIAVSYFQRALALIDDEPEHAKLLDQIGDVLHFIGKYTEARNAWEQSLQRSSSEDSIFRAHLYRKIGNSWRDQYQHPNALAAYDNAVAALSPDDDSSRTRLCWAEVNLDRISTLYWLSRTSETLELVEQIRPILQNYGSLRQQARLHQSIGLAIMRRDRFIISDDALYHARTYLRLSRETNDSAALPAAHFQLGGMLLWGRTDLDEAESEFSQALTLARERGDISLEGRCLTYLTFVARHKRDYKLAEMFAQTSLQFASNHALYDYVGAAYSNLAWLAWYQNDFQAVHHYEQQAFDIWQHLSTPYGFQWILRWPLVAVALHENQIFEAITHVQVLLDQSQPQLPKQVEETLIKAVRASEAQNIDDCKLWLGIAVQQASEEKYL
ncbi:MAG: AAA family ATPase [Chloroflexi bacterium]|nr:AAA family ATPase [Chloroflexota bacterium]MCC6891734.1 AAA family ATPase [Anaerolineae bacterium]